MTKKKPFLYRLVRIFFYEIGLWLDFLCIKYPQTASGDIIRKIYWRHKLKITTQFFIGQNTNILHSKLFTIGDQFHLGDNVILDAGGSQGVYIGNNVGIARGSYLRSANHKFDRTDISYLEQGLTCKILTHENGKNYSVIIEDDVLISANVIILSGAHIGRGSIIAAGAVISAKIPPYSIVTGNPGRVTGSRLKEKKEAVSLNEI